MYGLAPTAVGTGFSPAGALLPTACATGALGNNTPRAAPGRSCLICDLAIFSDSVLSIACKSLPLNVSNAVPPFCIAPTTPARLPALKSVIIPPAASINPPCPNIVPALPGLDNGDVIVS